MRYLKYFIVIFVVIKCNTSLTPASLDKAFETGVKAYTDERWSRCIEKFEESLHLFKLYKAINVNCRLKCNAQSYAPRIVEDIEDLKVYEIYFNKNDCIHKCQRNGFAAVNLNRFPDESVLRKMRHLVPYEYLHVCYFQMHMFHAAASAAFTYLVAHPEDEIMKKNVEYYIAQPEVDVNEMVDYEAGDYVLLYKLGKKSYHQDNWAETVASLEEAIKDYMLSENNCRAECEQVPAKEWPSDFVSTVSNNIAALLHCRQHCQDKLQYLKYDSGVEFIADVLNYLQMSYYYLEKFDAAAEAVATYLELHPTDEDMLENVKYYSKLNNKSTDAKRADVLHYMKRDKYEKDLLNFFREENQDNSDNNTV